MTLSFFLAFGILLGGWSFLRLLGNERQRLVQDRDAIARRDAAIAAAAAAKASETPVAR